MPRPFFPDPALAWSFYLLLVGLTALAAVLDLRTARVPKWLTLGTLAAGVMANVVRGAWLGARGEPLWLLSAPGPWAGALDGLLLALAGSLTAFGLFLALWLLGTCGGGDVKLFVALGAWVGPLLLFFLYAGSTVVLMVFFAGRLLRAGPAPSRVRAALRTDRPGGPARPSKRRMTFSLPVAVSAALILLWVFRADLNLVQRGANGVTLHAPRSTLHAEEAAHAR